MNVERRLPQEIRRKLKDVQRGRGYVTYGTGDLANTVVTVTCKRCGQVLQHLAQDARFPVKHSRVPGSDIVRRDFIYVLRPTPDYAEVTLELEEADGSLSLHTTPLCRQCTKAVSDLEAEDLFLADVEQWAIDDEVVGRDLKTHEQLFEAQARRTVRRVLHGEGG